MSKMVPTEESFADGGERTASRSKELDSATLAPPNPALRRSTGAIPQEPSFDSRPILRRRETTSLAKQPYLIYDMAYSALPTWPLFLFGILEPLMLVVAFYTLISDTQGFSDRQVPSILLQTLTPSTLTTLLMLGNVYLLLAGLAVLCCFTEHAEIARNYLLIVACADLGHISSAYVGMGHDRFMHVAGWNDMAWGNVGVSMFLCVNRVATAAGVFGRLGDEKRQEKVE